MFRSLRLGRAFGIPLFVHPTFFLLPLWVLFTQRNEGPVGQVTSLAFLGAVFGCVLLHELGHALMARYFGIGTRDVTLYPIGGVARLRSTGESPGEELCIALAGPAVNLVLFLLLLPVAVVAICLGAFAGPPGGPLFTLELGWLTLAARFLALLCLSNLVLLLFNLVPAFPMDGGRVLRALLSYGMPRLRATEIAAPLGLVVAALGLLWMHNPMVIVVALFVGFAGQQELRGLRYLEARKAEERRAARAERAYILDALPVEPERQAPSAGFTGFAWDQERGGWVRWLNGRPLDLR